MTNNLSLITSNKNRSSFTLIELLVVLALVAILSVVVVMTLNPAELIKQARDSNRLSDLATINTALNLFSTDVTSGFMGTSTVIYVSLPSTTSTCSGLGLPTLPSGYAYNCVTSQNLRNTDGTGWIPVNFQRISSNSPISQLPVDPTNTTSSGNYYTYMTGGSWQLASNMESAKQKSVSGASGTDGGVSLASYEIGNNLRLIPAGLLEWKRDSSLVGYWPFDEGSGATVYDWSGNGWNGSWTGTNSHYVSGAAAKVGMYSANISGGTDYMVASKSLSLNAYTLSAWANDSTSAASAGMVMAPGREFGRWPTNSLRFGNGGGYEIACAGVFTQNIWHFIVFTFDGSVGRLFFDGKGCSTVGIGATSASISGSMYMGRVSWNGYYYVGQIDDARVYNRALSAAEILALYNSTK